MVTSGNCSPAIVGNNGVIEIQCRINDTPLDEIVRRGGSNLLLDALNSGVPAETILQAFVAGNSKKLSGVSFFENAPEGNSKKLLFALSKKVNLNDPIYFTKDSSATLFWLAAQAGRKENIEMMTDMGLAIHITDHRFGHTNHIMFDRDFFPIVTLIREGTIEINDATIIEKLLTNSFIFPNSNAQIGRADLMSQQTNEFLRNNLVREKIISTLSLKSERELYDMGNVEALCDQANRSSSIDWCKRLKAISIDYYCDDKAGTHWPFSFHLIGLLNIGSDYASFMVSQTRNWGGIGQFWIPAKGHEFRLTLWNTSGSNATPCWSDKLQGYKKDCWRTYRFLQDIFDPNKLVGTKGYPTYTGGENTIINRSKKD